MAPTWNFEFIIMYKHGEMQIIHNFLMLPARRLVGGNNWRICYERSCVSQESNHRSVKIWTRFAVERGRQPHTGNSLPHQSKVSRPLHTRGRDNHPGTVCEAHSGHGWVGGRGLTGRIPVKPRPLYSGGHLLAAFMVSEGYEATVHAECILATCSNEACDGHFQGRMRGC